MDVRLIILAVTFSLLVVTAVSFVSALVRNRRMRKMAGPLQQVAEFPTGGFHPVDTNLDGLDVHVEADAPSASLLTPLRTGEWIPPTTPAPPQDLAAASLSERISVHNPIPDIPEPGYARTQHEDWMTADSSASQETDHFHPVLGQSSLAGLAEDAPAAPAPPQSVPLAAILPEVHVGEAAQVQSPAPAAFSTDDFSAQIHALLPETGSQAPVAPVPPAAMAPPPSIPQLETVQFDQSPAIAPEAAQLTVPLGSPLSAVPEVIIPIPAAPPDAAPVMPVVPVIPVTPVAPVVPVTPAIPAAPVVPVIPELAVAAPVSVPAPVAPDVAALASEFVAPAEVSAASVVYASPVVPAAPEVVPSAQPVPEPPALAPEPVAPPVVPTPPAPVAPTPPAPAPAPAPVVPTPAPAVPAPAPPMPAPVVPAPAPALTPSPTPAGETGEADDKEYWEDLLREQQMISAPAPAQTRVPRPEVRVTAAEAPVVESEPAPAPLPARPPRPVARVRTAEGRMEEFAPAPETAIVATERRGTRAVPDIVMEAPVEMWFGEARVGVKAGTATYDRFRKYADVLLSDLHSSKAAS